ncbi:MAG TPA: adenylate/guanylate cyclase domain-containing protein [Acidimicrobiia bacterium]|nr:adenylate/guanylate cyclase domain-containing protein [Acidimicrobiia bacterium]
MIELVASGKNAFDRHAWDEALEAFSEADRETGLAPHELEMMASAAWWMGRPDEAEEVLKRAFAGYSKAGDDEAAAAVAVRLCERAFRRGAVPVAHGWLSQAERLLEDHPDSPVQAWIEFMRVAEALFGRNDPDAAIEHADRAIRLGHQHHDADVQAIAMSFKGAALLRKGELDAGLALIDEATAAATTGVLDPKTACDVYCVTIGSCRTLGDYRRAGEWIDQAESWMQRESVQGYTGVCRVHRAELKRLRGAWSEAEQEARLACNELEKYRLMDEVGFAHSEVGEVRLRMGDLPAAEEAFTRAYQYGWDPQPGLAYLLLARGDADEAAESIANSLAAVDAVAGGEVGPSDPFGRGQRLPAAVDIALHRGDLPTALAATAELEELAVKYPGVAREATALTARGAVLLAEGHHAEAIGSLDKAWRLWQQLSLPYESARARVLLGRARLGAGNESGAHLELIAAQSAFRQLGAVADLEAVNGLLGDRAGTSDDRRRMEKTFLFTDIVTSTDLIGLIGDAAWEELLAWHDRTLRSAFDHHGGEVVRHTGDGFFVAFEDPDKALRCAVDIQRQLADHRRQHGFAPWVRIGMHTADATRQGSDYSGQGVHVAARVAALAEREEIVISYSTLARVTTSRPVSSPRSVSLKGIPEPIEVHTVDWH